MKLIVCFLLCLFLFSMLVAQAENWHVYYPGDHPNAVVWHESEVWVASEAGIMRFNPQTGDRTQYNSNNTPYPGSSINSICFDSAGELWAGGVHGALHFNGETWELFTSGNSLLPTNHIRKVIPDPFAGVWFATDYGICRYWEGEWIMYNATNSGYTPSSTFRDLSFDLSGYMWIATGNGVFRFDGSTWFSYNSGNSTLPSNEIFSIVFDALGIGWFAFSGGVARYDGESWQIITSLGGVSIGAARGCYVDQWQRIWIWSDSKLFWNDGANWQYYPISLFGSYSMNFRRMAVDDEQNLWLGLFDTYSPESLAHYDGENVTNYPISVLPLASMYVSSIFRGYDDKLWVGTSDSNGIGGYFSILDDDYDCFGMYNTPMPCDHVWALAQDSQLNMWVSSCLGLLKTGPTGSESFNSTDTGVGSGNAKTICPVGDGVWLGTSNGVSRYENGVWTPLTSTEAGMSLAGTNIIKTDTEGRVWIGCAAGVICCDQGQFITYPEATNANDFAFGESGEVWVARGVLSVLQDGIWTHYNADNSGLEENLVRTIALDQNQVLWLGTAFPECKIYRFDGENWSSFSADTSPLAGLSINRIYVDENNTK
jgi:ligand-binding sensor domain-containing protein